jgi:protein O-mannosyl-transferase
LLATVLIFANILGNGFVDWDDRPFLIDNYYIKTFGFRSLWVIFTTDMNVYRPVVYALYALLYRLFGLDPFVYHLASLVFHVVNVGLTYSLVRRLGYSPGVAAFVALSFAIHPTRTESVAWVLALTDPVYACFFLLAILYYLHYRQTNGSRWAYWLAVGAYTISLLAKPAAVVLPLVLWLVDYQQQRPFKLNALVDKIPFLLGSVGFAYLTLHLGVGKDYNLRPSYTGPETLLLSGYSLAYYVKVLIYPANLAFFYIQPLKVAGQLPVMYGWASLASLGLLVGLGGLWWRRQHHYFFAGAFFLVNLLLVLYSARFSHSVVNDRYTYISAIGAFLGIALLAQAGAGLRPGLGRALWVAGAMLLGTWGWATHHYNRDWANSEVHYRAAIASQPAAAPVAYCNLADELGRLGRGSLAERQTLYERAISSFPQALNSYLGLAEVTLAQGKLGAADSALRMALRLRPDHPRAHLYEGQLLAQRGQWPAALAALNRAVALDKPYGYFPEIYLARAKLHLAMGQNAAACADLKVALATQQAGVADLVAAHCGPVQSPP